MPYLIDGANLGGSLGGRDGARDAEAVVRFLVPWTRGRGRVLVVFDGAGDGALPRALGSLEIVWSGAGRSADDWIVGRLGSRARDWIVITDDRELGGRCRERGARVERTAEFAARAAGAHGAGAAVEKPEPGPDEVAAWKDLFDPEGRD